MNRFRFAHLSDLHLPLAEAPPRWRDLISKRLFSWLSWRANRRFVHRPEALAEVMADVHAHGPDHLLVTGDLVNLALPDEFERARDWLAARGSGEAVTAIPGNHDALVPVDWARGPGLWRDWMGGVERDGFPFVKRVGEAALIGVSSAIPTALFQASGRVGEGQLQRLEKTLQALEAEGLFRIVLIHHPITDGAVVGRKALKDRAALRAVLARAGAELVLHGHSHESAIASVPGPRGDIPVVSVPSASAAPDAHGEPAGWGLLEVTPTNEAWRVSVSLRRLGRDGRFDEADHRVFELPRPR